MSSTATAKPPLNWKRSAPGPPASSVTAAGQSELPQLPVPAVPDTLTRLRRSLQPLTRSPDELAATNRKIGDFENGIAAELQRRLLQRAQETDHWLEEWWDRNAYMAYRDSVVVNVSYFYGFDKHPSQYPQTPAHRAAVLTRSGLLFRQAYRQGKLTPERTKEGPICMNSYRWMFDACRIPGLGGEDWARSYATPEDTGSSGHIVVLRKNRFWKIDIAPHGQILSTSDLEAQFTHIYDNTTQHYPGVGVLTASNRDVWAKDYNFLTTYARNNAIVKDIQSAAFLVCLDDTRSSDNMRDLDAFSRQLWHGGQSGKWLVNRWVDKPLQFIVCDGPDVPAGIMCEHSCMDGMPTARMCNDVVGALHSPSFDHGSSSPSSLQPPTPLDFYISPHVVSAIKSAADAAKELTDSQVLHVVGTSYGKAAVKRFGFSPDSWAQLLIQLAYARLLKRLGQERNGGTYEAATTRKFVRGRTETVRVVSVESDEWCAAMDDKGKGEAERRELFRKAAAYHIKLAREAGNGQGADRHLLGTSLFHFSFLPICLTRSRNRSQTTPNPRRPLSSSLLR